MPLTLRGGKSLPTDPERMGSASPRGPHGKRPPARDLVMEQASAFARMLVNPYLLVSVLAQLGGQVLAILRHIVVGARVGQCVPSLSLPFEGEWNTENGGLTKADSHSWGIVAQRYAYDFLIVDETGKTARGAGMHLADYYCYDRPVLAAADGRVVAVRDGMRECHRPGRRRGPWFIRDLRGNHVIVAHDGGFFSLSAHLRPGTIGVRVGDRISRGEELGRCGNSGNSTEPHLHFQVQDHRSFFLSVSQPVAFTQVRRVRDGVASVWSTVFITRGDAVSSAPADSDAVGAESALSFHPYYLGVADLASSIAEFVATLVGFGAIFYHCGRLVWVISFGWSSL